MISPSQRADNVRRAVDALSATTAGALASLGAYGPTDPRTLAAWEQVEQHGAIVHRQSRLLAGKRKGG